MEFNTSPTLLPQLFPLKDRKLRFETLQIHGGTPHKDPATNSKAIPIYQTSSYVYDADAQGEALFNLSSCVKGNSNIYGRIGNPTVDAFERRVSALEGGIAAVACSSGQAAQFMALTCIANSGDNIVSTCQIYGGTHNQLKYLLTRFGITTKFADGDEAGQIEAVIDSETKAIFCEMIGNPQSNVPNIPALAEVARRHGIPLIIDNTFGACGYIARPLDMGADIVVESASKWICGHGTTMGGIVVDSGRFDWGQSGKFKTFTSPIEASGGWMGNNLVSHSFWHTFKEQAFTTKLRYELLRDMGACLEPMSAWLLLQGLETLSLRMERHQQNAMAVARFLEKHPKVAWVSYLGLPSHAYHETAKILLKGFGSTLAFGVKGGRGADVIKALKLHSAVPNAGSVHSLAIHPASMTHVRWTEENRLGAGISQDLIRLSVGIEHIDDIIEDLNTAIDQVKIDATAPTPTAVKPEHIVDHLNLKLSIDLIESSTYKIGRNGVPTPAMA